MPTLSSWTEIGTTTTLFSCLIHSHITVGGAHDAHQLTLGTLRATGYTGPLWDVLTLP